MTDQTTTLADLKQIVQTFVDERDWQQFHSPKNLSMAMAIEVAELMEHFQWISIDESRTIHDDPQKRQEICEELSDVFCYVLALANEMNVDLSQCLSDKMIKNRKKYPAEEYQGRF